MPDWSPPNLASGLNERTDVGRIRLLDPAESAGGLRDIGAPIDDLATLGLSPQAALIVENLQTFLSLPMMPGVVAAHGSSTGDLDSHGFRILNQARSVGLEAQSVLMDSGTLYEHQRRLKSDPFSH